MIHGYDMKKSSPRSRASIDLDKVHGHGMPKVKVGDKHKMTVRGRVTSLSSDDYGHRMGMDVDDVAHGDEEPRSLTRAMKARRRSQHGHFA